MDHKEIRLAVILSMDVPGLHFSGREEEEDARLIERCGTAVRSCAAEYKGELLQSIGDSFLIAFTNSLDAVQCAQSIQDKFRSIDSENPSATLLPRIGIHLGEIFFIEHDAAGDTVTKAVSLQAVARPGYTCVSKEVWSLVEPKLVPGTGFSCKPLSPSRAKSLPGANQDAMQVFEIKFSGNVGSETNSQNSAINEKSNLSTRLETPVKAPGENQENSGDNSLQNSSFNSEHQSANLNSSPENIVSSIKVALLDDIRASGRRLTVDEALEKYGYYGVEAKEAIAQLADSGILIRSTRNGGQASFNSTSDLGKSIEQAVHAIVHEIERSVREGDFKNQIKSSSVKKVVKEEIKNSFKITEERDRKQHRERRARKREVSTTNFEAYKNELVKKQEKLAKSIPGGIVSFVIVNSALFFFTLKNLNGFPWPVFVALFWLFGIIDNVFSYFRVRKQNFEVQALPDLDETETREIREIHKERDKIGKSFINLLTIPTILMLINLATRGRDPWFLIPSGIIAVSFLAQVGRYFSTIPARTRKFFEKIGISGGKRGLKNASAQRMEESGVELGEVYDALYRNAKEAAADIERSLRAHDTKEADEMKPQLNSYLNQVLLLAKTTNEIDTIISEIPMDNLARDKASLVAKLSSAEPAMRAEYEANIREIEKQESSFKALNEQKEIMDLRLKASVNQLQQLKMELARTRAMDAETSALEASSAISSLRSKSVELANYLEDLKGGMIEAAEDPFSSLGSVSNLVLDSSKGENPSPPS